MKAEINFSDVERLSQNIAKLGKHAEKALNNSLDKHAERILTSRISPLIKVSRERDGRGIRDKVHARNAKWSKAELGNLEITIKSKGGAANKKGSFGYLVFPDEGRGSQNRVAQKFVSRGAEAGTPELLDVIQTDLVNRLEEEL